MSNNMLDWFINHQGFGCLIVIFLYYLRIMINAKEDGSPKPRGS